MKTNDFDKIGFNEVETNHYSNGDVSIFDLGDNCFAIFSGAGLFIPNVECSTFVKLKKFLISIGVI